MKKVIVAVSLLALAPAAASAAASAVELQAGATKSVYACQGSALSRVALRDDPAPCCDGRIRCAQLLSTQGMIRPHTRPRA